MRPFTYASDSGIRLDICDVHGIWFDGDELRRVIEFVQSGGLAASLARRRNAQPLGLRSYTADDRLATLFLILEVLVGFFDI